MGDGRNGFRLTDETSFVVLRALAMLGGLTAVFLVQHPPEHQPYLGGLAWAFVAYKLLLFLAIRVWVARLRIVLLATTVLDLVVRGALRLARRRPGEPLLSPVLPSGGACGGPLRSRGRDRDRRWRERRVRGGFRWRVAAPDWTHLIARVATFFLLGGALGYLSRRERLARSRGGGLNEELKENQRRLEKAYQELQAAQERLVQSERLATIGQMSAKVSHEVRNPLSSISLNVELLEDELSALPAERRAEARHLVRAIRSQVDVLSAVTEEYLGFARLPKPKLEVVSLGSVIADLADFVREELRARKVQLVVDAEPGLPDGPRGCRPDPSGAPEPHPERRRGHARRRDDQSRRATCARRWATGQPGNRAIGIGVEIGCERRISDCQIAKLPSCQRRRIG